MSDRQESHPEKAGHRRWPTHEMPLSAKVAMVSRQTGKPFARHDLGEAQHAAALEQVGLPRAFAEMVAQVEAQGISTGVLHDDSGILGKLIDRPTTTLAEAISTALTSLPVA